MAGLVVLSRLRTTVFWETFHGNFYLFSEFLPEICWEDIAEKNTFCILFWCPAKESNPGFMRKMPTHHLLDHGDFNVLQPYEKNSFKSSTYLLADFFYILFWCLARDSNPEFTRKKPTHYLVDYGNFKIYSNYMCNKR